MLNPIGFSGSPDLCIFRLSTLLSAFPVKKIPFLELKIHRRRLVSVDFCRISVLLGFRILEVSRWCSGREASLIFSIVSDPLLLGFCSVTALLRLACVLGVNLFVVLKVGGFVVMEKDKSPVHGGGGGCAAAAAGSSLPPPLPRYAALASPSSSFPIKGEASYSSSIPGSTPESGHFGQMVVPDAGQFSHDISQMPEHPPRNVGHRRVQSEILGLPDDISFDGDLGVVGSGECPSMSDETEEDLLSMYLDMDKLTSSSATSELDLLGSENSVTAAAPAPTFPLQTENSASASNGKPRVRHQHSQSMDGSTSIKPEILASGSEGPSLPETKKAMSAAKLADLALVDPKRAKRIWANRQSAARSKERKMRYIAELERKVQTLQTEATTLSAQLTLLQRDTSGLTAENNELKLRLQTMEQQVHLQDALNDALREEVQRLKIATGQANPNGGQMMNFRPSFGATQQYYHHRGHAMQPLLAARQLQQLQIHSQHQQQMHPQQHQPQVQQQQQQSPAELKMKGVMTSQRESTSDNSSSQE